MMRLFVKEWAFLFIDLVTVYERDKRLLKRVAHTYGTSLYVAELAFLMLSLLTMAYNHLIFNSKPKSNVFA
jgi:hypothetical protein